MLHLYLLGLLAARSRARNNVFLALLLNISLLASRSEFVVCSLPPYSVHDSFQSTQVQFTPPHFSSTVGRSVPHEANWIDSDAELVRNGRSRFGSFVASFVPSMRSIQIHPSSIDPYRFRPFARSAYACHSTYHCSKSEAVQIWASERVSSETNAELENSVILHLF